jgi:hypothetical protein
MIRTTGHLAWSERHQEWVHRVSTMEVACDHVGCSTTVIPSGWETNGPNIESVYGAGGWDLNEDTHHCPQHQTARAHECDFCGCTVVTTLSELKAAKWLCDDCRPVELLTDVQLKRTQRTKARP